MSILGRSVNNLCKLLKGQRLELRYAVRCYEQESIKRRELVDDPGTIQSVKIKMASLMGAEKGYYPLLKSRQHLMDMLPKSQNDLPPRTMNDSFDSAVIPLSTDLELQQKYITFLGHVRLGRLMEDMDLFAGYLGFRHLLHPSVPNEPWLLTNNVTVLIDEVVFSASDLKPDADIRLSGHVCWVGATSMEVVVWLEQMQHGAWQKITRALFLMAARNSVNSGSAFVNKLVAENEEEAKILKGGEDRKRRRQQTMSRSLLKTIPDQNEQQLIHELYLKTIDPSDLTCLKRVLPSHSMWMKEAQLHNLVFCHPEDRNLHNKIFGGFLLRNSLELAWSCGYMHSKHRPTLLHISDIAFHKAVDVGSMLKMHSHVTYTEKNYMQIVVFAEVFDPHTGEHSTTNIFHYTFESAEPVLQVVPKTYHEAMMYVDGRRHFQHVMGLTSSS